MKSSEKNLAFLKSALTLDNPMMPIEKVLVWIQEKNDETPVNIRKIAFAEMRNWAFEQNTGNLVHDSGKFFSIGGIRIKTSWGLVEEWEQPIIDQPEIGYLGIIAQKIDGVLYFLMQAKIEPGNINAVQLSPTLQATKSNYTQVHKGRKPLYIEYFNGEREVEILLDQLQSEQGARFLRKRNRNVVVLIPEDEKIPVLENFCWLTLAQIKYFLLHDNIVNMDTRTVISGVPFGEYPSDVIEFYSMLSPTEGDYHNKLFSMLFSALERDRHLHSIDDIISWITRIKSKYDLFVDRIPLRSVKKWMIGDDEIYHEEHKYFSVIAANIQIDNREVQSWDQPLVKAAQEGVIAFIIKEINGIYHFLVQAKLEAGNFDIIELAPTVQCLTGNYRKGNNEYTVPFLDYVLNVENSQIWYSTLQSEEGGRFFREQNRNMIVEARDDLSIELPENYIWMTLRQLKAFVKYNNYLNIAARSLVAAVRFI